MIRTVAAIMLSGLVGAGSVATYDRLTPQPQPQTIDLSALTQAVTQLTEQQRAQAQLIGDLNGTLKQQQAGILLVHQDLLRQEAVKNGERAQEQAVVNRLNADADRLIKSMPR